MYEQCNASATRQTSTSIYGLNVAFIQSPQDWGSLEPSANGKYLVSRDSAKEDSLKERRKHHTRVGMLIGGRMKLNTVSFLLLTVGNVGCRNKELWVLDKHGTNATKAMVNGRSTTYPIVVAMT